jgi:ribosomal protein L40E
MLERASREDDNGLPDSIGPSFQRPVHKRGHGCMRPSMLPMPSHQCRFCGHVNPDGAKYCNECGTQLNLRPCRLCDAINDVAADHCHKCGAALPEQPAPALAPVAAAAALSGALAPLREGESEPILSAGDAAAIAGDADAAVGSDVRPAVPPEDRRPDVETRPAPRWAWVAATLAAVGIAAYLAYSPDRTDDAAGSSQARQGGRRATMLPVARPPHRRRCPRRCRLRRLRPARRSLFRWTSVPHAPRHLPSPEWRRQRRA